jgi:hypothetical protein
MEDHRKRPYEQVQWHQSEAIHSENKDSLRIGIMAGEKMTEEGDAGFFR